MTQCIRINSTENLPLEQTLLLHYKILCTGVWDLAQLLSAYRNICDDQWTVMYPNFQHPRHTDFPITVTTPGQDATFAWNYGGIQGISAENFDESHSFLTQLCIFNYDCTYTGQNSGSEPTGSGSSGSPPISGGPIISGYHPGGGGPGPIGPRPPLFPPIPGNIFPPNYNTNDPVFNSTPPIRFDDPIITGEPSGQDPFIRFNPIDPEEIGSRNSDPVFTPTISVLTEVEDPNRYTGVVRSLNPNSTLPPYIGNYNTETRSSSIPSIPELAYGGLQVFGSQASTVVTSSSENIGSVRGTLSSSVISESLISIENNISLRQISTANVIPGSFTYIELGSDEIEQGAPAIISCIYRTPVGVEVNTVLQLYVITPGDAVYLLMDMPSVLTTNTSPSNLAGSFPTTNFNLGGSTIVLLAKNSLNQVIGMASRVLIIREPQSNSGNGNSAGSPRITSRNTNGLTQGLTNGGNNTLSSEAQDITLPLNSSINLIYESDNNASLTSVFVGNNAEVVYGITVANLNTSTYSGSTISYTGGILGQSDGRMRVNEIEVSPSTHTSAVRNVDTSNASILSITPSVTNTSKATNSKLYVSNTHTLREWSSSVTNYSGLTATVSVSTPYAATQLKLIVHGYVSGDIDPTYTLYSSETNISGDITYNSVSIQPEQYYSIVTEGDGTYNPYKYIARTFLYDY